MTIRTNVIQAIQRLRYQDPANPTADELAIRQRFLQKHPDLEAEVITFQDDPNCNCRGKIMGAITGQRSKDPEEVEKELTEILGEQVELTQYRQAGGEAGGEAPGRQPRDFLANAIVGEVHTINDDDQEYTQYLKSLMDQGKRWRGLTVRPMTIDGESKLKLYFT